MPKFSAAHPECTIVVRNLGVEDPALIRTGLALPVNDPTRPHLWWIASSETGAYVEADVLADVDGWLNKNPQIKANIIPALLELSSYEGKVRSLPWMTNNTAMWVNVDAFEKAGVPIPSQKPEETWTWEEFATAMQKVTEANAGMKGFLVTINTGWDFWTFHSWYAAAGGDVSSVPVLDSPAALKAVQFQRDLLANGYAATTPTGWDAAPWYAQQVAVMANGPWNFPMLSTFTDFKFTIVPYPRDVKPAANLGGNQLFIGKTANAAQEACACAFGEYILTDEFQIAFQKQSGNLPVTTSAAASEEYQTHLAKYPFMAGFVNQTPFGVARMPIPLFGEITNLFTPAWDAVMVNGADVSETFKALQLEVNSALGQ
jgi:multiple sugar transport system substrate-binding protein